jgi:hypothetical protein
MKKGSLIAQFLRSHSRRQPLPRRSIPEGCEYFEEGATPSLGVECILEMIAAEKKRPPPYFSYGAGRFKLYYDLKFGEMQSRQFIYPRT